MRSSTLKQLDITAQIEAFFAKGGKVKECPYGTIIRDNDGMTPRQIDQRTYAARMEREAAK